MLQENGAASAKATVMSLYQAFDRGALRGFGAVHSGFEANTERTEGTYSKYNSIDDKTDGYHYWTTYIKFGIGRATYDASQEIRNHHLTREEGVALRVGL